MLDLNKYKIKERLDLILKNAISYEYTITKEIKHKNDIIEIESDTMFTNDINELDKDYTIETLSSMDGDYYNTHKYLDDRFPINKYDFEKELEKENYQSQFTKGGKLLKLVDTKRNISQRNIFDENGNIILSIFRKESDEIEERTNYIYDNKNRLIERVSDVYYIGEEKFGNAYRRERITYNDEDKTSRSICNGSIILTQWDDEFKYPLIKIALINPYNLPINYLMNYRDEEIVYEISEYTYPDENTTIIKTKKMNTIL